MVILTVLYGFGYIAYSTYGFQNHPKKKYYNRLFNFNIAFRDFFVCSLVGLWGYIRIQCGVTNETFVFAPIVFIPLLLLANSVVLLAMKRNIIIATRWDIKPTEYRWYVDGVFSIIIVTVPLVACGYFMNYLKFGEIIR